MEIKVCEELSQTSQDTDDQNENEVEDDNNIVPKRTFSKVWESVVEIVINFIDIDEYFQKCYVIIKKYIKKFTIRQHYRVRQSKIVTFLNPVASVWEKSKF